MYAVITGLTRGLKNETEPALIRQSLKLLECILNVQELDSLKLPPQLRAELLTFFYDKHIVSVLEPLTLPNIKTVY